MALRCMSTTAVKAVQSTIDYITLTHPYVFRFFVRSDGPSLPISLRQSIVQTAQKSL